MDTFCKIEGEFNFWYKWEVSQEFSKSRLLRRLFFKNDLQLDSTREYFLDQISGEKFEATSYVKLKVS